MAIAIHNGLNKPENCHFYLADTMAQNDGRLRSLFTGTNAGMCVVDEQLTVLFVNDALCKMFGTTKERIIGTQLFKAQFEAYLANERPVVEFRIKRPDGNHTSCLFNASEYQQETLLGKHAGYFAMITDITRAKQVQANTMKLEDAKV
jgi:PAS domain S-box-containing protein